MVAYIVLRLNCSTVTEGIRRDIVFFVFLHSYSYRSSVKLSVNEAIWF